MATREQQRASERRARQKKRRENAQKSRRTRANASWQTAASWPWREAWVSDAWLTPGSSPIVGFARRGHDSGQSAWCRFKVDLDPAQISEVASGIGSEDQARAEFLQLAADTTMLESTPASVAYLLEEALAHGSSSPDGLAQVELLFRDVDADESDISVQFADDAPTDPGIVAPPPGAFHRLWDKVFGRSTS